jgi:NAD(P)-dependent dehydrogenase (short-subunit alcohol dehydrogenase family)
VSPVAWDPKRIPDQTGKTFVVTGGHSGIGYWVSEQLAQAGAHVVMAGRTPRKLDAARHAILARVPDAEVDGVQLDLASLASVRESAQRLSTLGSIDGLIENAGTIMASKQREETADGFEAMFGVNHLGHFLLTALLYPRIRESAGRIVAMGSGATRLTRIRLDDLQSTDGTFSAWRAYGQSKHATQAFGFELDRRLRAAGSPAAALVAHPGAVRDGVTPTRVGVIEPTTAQRLADRFIYVITRGKDVGAWPMVRAATDPEAHGGQYWGPRGFGSGQPRLNSPVAADRSPELGRELWTRSEEAVGQEFVVD